MSESITLESQKRIVLAWVFLCVLLGATTLPGIDHLGLYYDEAFLAQQARGFVEPERAGQHPGSVRSIEILGRPFPLKNAAYLGSLKSQLLIPAMATGGASVRLLRTTTLATAALALLLAMLWAGRLFGEPATILMGAFVASDPSFYFFSQFEWGPFTTNFLCRSAGALLLLIAWRSPSPKGTIWAAGGAGVALGLGIFSRADFSIILICAGVALLLCRIDLVIQAWRDRRAAVLVGSAALLAFALPMLISSVDLMASSQAIADRGGFAFRVGLLERVLNGSQFHGLMRAGGVFERVPDYQAEGSLLALLMIPAAAVLTIDLWHRRRDGASARHDPRLFLLLMTGLLLLGMLILPGAVRAHHQLNVLPLPHLVLACGLVSLWDLGPARKRWLGRTAAGLAGVLLLVGNLAVIGETQREIQATGGRGRFSSGLSILAEQLDERTNARAVSLDWGFHEPLLYLTNRAQMVEPIWSIPGLLARGRPWAFSGDEATTYLVHGPKYDLFGIGPALLVAARANPDPSIKIEPYRDGAGEVAFYSVTIGRPHELSFNGSFRIRPR